MLPFNNSGLGLGKLGPVTFIRKIRHTISAQFPFGKLPETFVKISHRLAPPFTEGGEFTTTIFDVSKKEQEDIFAFLTEGFNKKYQGELPEEQLLGAGLLSLYSGCGELIETWTLHGLSLNAVNFMALSHSSSDQEDIEITWKYRNATWKSTLPKFSVNQEAMPPTRQD